LGSAIAVGNIPSSISRSLDGGLVGGTIGYNWQFDTSFVVGIEGDLDWVDARNSTSVSPIVPPFAPATTTGFRALDWLGTIRGRVGFTPAPPILIYLTGGLAVGEHELGITAVGPTWGPPLDASSTARPTSAGWTVGGGVEWKFAPQWSVKAEYLYVDLGDTNTTINYTYGPTSSLTAHARDTYNIARIGLNYTFDIFAPPAPVVAKY
jgi:outer membrane immunogenic protein